MSLWGDDDRDEKRAFPENVKKHVYVEQNQKCAVCGEAFVFKMMEFHHIKPHSDGGSTTKRNCIGLCPNCHARVTKKMITPDFKTIKAKMAARYEAVKTQTEPKKVRKAPIKKTSARKAPTKKTSTTRKTITKKAPTRAVIGRKKRPATRSKLRSRA